MDDSRRDQIGRRALTLFGVAGCSQRSTGLAQLGRLPAIAIGCALVLVCQLLVAAPTLGGGNEGVFDVLAASDAPEPGQTICVQVALRAITRVESSNLRLVISTGGGTEVASLIVSPIKPLYAGETWDHTWCLSNDGFPEEGTYTIDGCWSMGQAGTCNVARGQTTFFSVPVLGPLGLLALLGVVGAMIRRAMRTGAVPLVAEA